MNALLWSIRRELWEHRWIYRIPTLIGAMVITVCSGVFVSHSASLVGAEDGVSRLLTVQALSGAFDLTSRMMLIAGIITSYVYCSEALHGERRDRAILFWKSWPVGDVTAVAAKATVAMLIVPALTLALLLSARLMVSIVLIGKVVALTAPMANPGAASLEVVASTLWTAPVYAWVLLVSAWARRAVLLIAFLPPALVSMLGVMTRASPDASHALFYRGVGRHWPMDLTLVPGSKGPMVSTPAGELLRSPALWLGVGVALVLLMLVTALRRRMTAFA